MKDHHAPARPHWTIDGFALIEDAAALAKAFALDRAGAGWRNPVSLLNIGGDMLGGHIAALGLHAALLEDGESTADLIPCAAHVLFAARPDPALPCDIRVETLRVGRRFVIRRVDLMQSERLCAHLTATLARGPLSGDASPYHHAPPPVVPPPETLPTRAQQMTEGRAPRFELWNRILAGHPWFDIRHVEPSIEGGPVRHFWLRVPALARDAGAVGPASSTLQSCLLLLASDFWCTLPVHQLPGARAALGDNFVTLSLDHAAAFHLPPDCGEWLLWECDALAPGTGLAQLQSRVWARDGRMIANFHQQALVMPSS